MLTWLADVLRAEGLDVREQTWWRSRGRSTIDPKVVVVHHTGNPGSGEFDSLGWITDGSPIAPLANLHLSRSGRVWTVVAAGAANNAGEGGWPPKGATWNGHTIGIEAEHSGDPADPWPSYGSYVRGVAAICRHLRWDASHVVGHKEWAPGRKVDPTFDMDQFRADVAALLKGGWMPARVLIYAKRGTVDALSALAAAAAVPDGVAVTLDLADAKRALTQGTNVVAVGGPAAEELPGATKVVGKNAPDTLAQIAQLAGRGWR